MCGPLFGHKADVQPRAIVCRGRAVAWWLERRTLSRENSDLNPLAIVLKLQQFHSLCVAIHSAVQMSIPGERIVFAQ